MISKKIDHAFIMAAGRGTRLMPLTKKIPKGLIKFKQSSLIANGIKKLKKYINNVHITVGYKGAMLSKYVIEKDVSSVINTEGKGNSWWIYNSLLKNLDEPIWVLTCDNIVDIDFKSLSMEYFQNKAPACMIVPVYPLQGIDGDYISKDSKNMITKISRSKISSIYCSGIQIINPSKVNALTKESENFNEVWKQLIIKKEIICAKETLAKWTSIDDLNQLNEANINLDNS